MLKSNIKCPYFNSGIENFGLIMKGSSLENIEKIHDKFDHCFLINNFDLEIEKYGKYLENKKLFILLISFSLHICFKKIMRDLILNIQMSTNFF